MATTVRPIRPPRLAALLGGLVVALAGCAPITTQQTYAASDGVIASLEGEVTAGNLMILTDGEGEPGLLLGALVNRTHEDTQVTVRVGSEAVNVPMRPGETVLLSSPHAVENNLLTVLDVPLDAVPAPPGAFTDVEISTPASGSMTVAVPVLDGTLPPYDEVVPTAGSGASTNL